MPGDTGPTGSVRDFSGSRAVLIGTWDYEHLPPVPAARNSLERMTALLTSPVCGWPADRITTVANRARPGDLYDDLVELYSQTAADGVALFYFVGHGQPDSDDRLCLGLAASRTEAARRASTSLLFDNVRDALRESDAETKIVILDCCFAGLAAANRLSGGDFLDMVRGTGAYTMAASGAYSPAWYEVDESVAKPQTFFTKYFADVVEAGIPQAQPVLPLDVIFSTAADRLVRDGKPKPTSTVRHEAGRLGFARNLAPVSAPPAGDQAEIDRLTAALAAAQEQAEKLAQRNLESQREIDRLRAARHGDPEADRAIDERLDALQRSVNDTATETAQALGERERVRHALVEAAPGSAAAGWDDETAGLSADDVVATIADPAADDELIQRILLSCGLRPVREVAEIAIGLKRVDHDPDARTVLRLTAQRPAAEIAQLVRLLRASPVPGSDHPPVPVPSRDPTTGETRLRHDDMLTHHERIVRWMTERDPLSHAVLAPAAMQPNDHVVAVVTALTSTGADPADVDYLLTCAGWQKPADQLDALVAELRAAGRDSDVETVLVRAGGRPTEVLAELIRTAGADGRTTDIETMLRGMPNESRSREDKRRLTDVLQQTSLPAAAWRPALDKQAKRRSVAATPGFGAHPGPVTARLVPYSIVALVVGLGVSQYAADPALGVGGWLATVVSTAALLAVAQFVYWLIDQRKWNGTGDFHYGPLSLLVVAMLGAFLIGLLVLPLLGLDPLGAMVRDVLAWRF